MRRSWLTPLAIASLLITSALAADRTQSDEQAIRKAGADFETARAAKGLEGWLSFFAEDATDIAAGGPIADKAAMRARLEKRWNNDLILKWRPVKIRVARGGDLAFSVGTWQLSDKSKPTAGVMATGKYLTVWGKQQDGSWRVLADTGVEDPTPLK